MVELDQFRYRISGYDKPMAQIKNSLDLDNKQKRIAELEADMESPDSGIIRINHRMQ